MKKNIIIICLSIFTLISCTNSEESIYSCDPTVNTWVKSNISKIDKMNRSEWLQLNEQKKIPAYRAFNSSQKQLFWLLKIDEVLQLGSWSNEEKLLLEKLSKKLQDNPRWFELDFKKDEIAFMEMEKFAYEWRTEAKEKLGWSDSFIKSIASSGNKVVDKKGSLEIVKIKSNVRFKSSASESGSSTCNCGVGYFWSTCESSISPETTCKSDGCSETSDGCGWLLRYKCDGSCLI